LLKFVWQIADVDRMTNSLVAVDGSVYVAKDSPEVIRDAVLALLVQKFPEKLSEQEISDFVSQCRLAIKVANAFHENPQEV